MWKLFSIFCCSSDRKQKFEPPAVNHSKRYAPEKQMHKFSNMSVFSNILPTISEFPYEEDCASDQALSEYSG